MDGGSCPVHVCGSSFSFSSSTPGSCVVHLCGSLCLVLTFLSVALRLVLVWFMCVWFVVCGSNFLSVALRLVLVWFMSNLI